MPYGSDNQQKRDDSLQFPLGYYLNDSLSLFRIHILKMRELNIPMNYLIAHISKVKKVF